MSCFSIAKILIFNAHFKFFSLCKILVSNMSLFFTEKHFHLGMYKTFRNNESSLSIRSYFWLSQGATTDQLYMNPFQIARANIADLLPNAFGEKHADISSSRIAISPLRSLKSPNPAFDAIFLQRTFRIAPGAIKLYIFQYSKWFSQKTTTFIKLMDNKAQYWNIVRQFATIRQSRKFPTTSLATLETSRAINKYDETYEISLWIYIQYHIVYNHTFEINESP